jgi:hypothetical protein
MELIMWLLIGGIFVWFVVETYQYRRKEQNRKHNDRG